jgi:hypothetical protein
MSTAVVQEHSHRWRIGEPAGPTSPATCRCGAVREFRNWIREADYLTREERRAAEFDAA